MICFESVLADSDNNCRSKMRKGREWQFEKGDLRLDS